MIKFLKKLTSFAVIVFFVAAVFAVVTYAQNEGSNSTVSNCTVTDDNNSSNSVENNSCSDNTSTIDENNTCENNTAPVDTTPSCSDNSSTSSNDTNCNSTAEGTGVKITALHPWVTGSQEYFNITNNGSYPVDMNGWQLEERQCGTNYTFPEVVIQPGATLQVFTRSGNDTESTFYMGFKEHIFSTHDEAKLVYETDFKV